MSFVPPQEQSIATAFRQAVADLLALRDEDDDALEAEDPWTSTYKLSDEIARLRIWAREHEAESGRLDYKLREASPLRDRVLNLLGNVSGKMCTCQQKVRPLLIDMSRTCNTT